jgi:catechol 2,3-dioxygenase-like lactoylglutathione lyase family enzyme
VVPRFHHVNLGVPPGVEDAEGDFLVGVLGYRRLESPPAAQARNARWFEGEDGAQVHLSVDPEHRPAAKAHTAVVVGDEADAIEARLVAAGIEYATGGLGGVRVLLCRDPAGNSWELRSSA